jgi:hypothetical protein
MAILLEDCAWYTKAFGSVTLAGKIQPAAYFNIDRF